MTEQNDQLRLPPVKFKPNDPVFVAGEGGKKYPGKVLRVDRGYYEDRATRYTVRIVASNGEEVTNWYREEYLEKGDINRLPKALREFQAIAPVGVKEVKKPGPEEDVEPGPRIPTVEELVAAGYKEDAAKRTVEDFERVAKLMADARAKKTAGAT